MRVIGDIKVFSISDVVGEGLWATSPGDLERVMEEWCRHNDVPYGKGELKELLQEKSVREKGRVLLAEVNNIR